jgi:hypothetical protein
MAVVGQGLCQLAKLAQQGLDSTDDVDITGEVCNGMRGFEKLTIKFCAQVV